jgi:hypothetical protein
MVDEADPVDRDRQAASPSACRSLRLWRLVVPIAILSAMVGCNNDTSSDPSAKVLQCARKQYADYNPKIMKHCVDVCIACERGSMTTCSTSCTMKGAK